MKLRKIISLAVAVALILTLVNPEMQVSAAGAAIGKETERTQTEGESNFIIDENGVLTKYQGSGGDVVIPEGVTGIGDSAFFGCSGLTSISIPGSVTNIGDYAFAGCRSLTSITVDEKNPKYDSRENCNAIIETETNTLIAGCSNTTIPGSVTSIGDNAFYECSSLTSISIPGSVTSIGDSAFAGCSSLVSISIPGSVTSIGSWAFRDCSGLTSISIPEGVTSIEVGAFYECSSLRSISIPGSVTSIEVGAFAGCSSLTSITVDEKNPKYDSRENCNAIIETATNTLLSGCRNTTILGSVTSIGGSAFEGCSSLASISIPEGVESIEQQPGKHKHPGKCDEYRGFCI